MMPGKHKGREVTKQNIKITNAGDGLSDALEVTPADLGYGDVVYVLLMCEAIGDGYKPVGEKELAEIWQLKTRTATLLESRVAAGYIEAQQAQIDAHKQAQKDAEQLAMNADPLGVFDGDEDKPKKPRSVKAVK